MSKLIGHLNAFMEILYKTVRLFGSIMLAALICMTGIDVFMRYAFNNPILGSNEMTQFLLGGLVFSGFALVAAHRSHIVVSLFETPLNRHIPFLYNGLVSGFNVVGITAVAYIVYLYTKFQFLMQAETEILEFAWADLGVALAVLSVLGILFSIKSLKYPRRHGSYNPYKQAVMATDGPLSVELVGDQQYVWCACGLSKNQPFCDGSHKGTNMTPVVFDAAISGPSKLCGCKRSTNAPYCNGTHNDN